jgi:hypothetical protein
MQYKTPVLKKAGVFFVNFFGEPSRRAVSGARRPAFVRDMAFF